MARFYIDESDAEAKKQNVIATRIMGQSALFVARTVIMELEWVLRGGYGYSRDETALILDHLMGLDNITVENWERVSDALCAYKDGMDFADALHLAASKGDLFTTFDTKLAKRAKKLGLKPTVTDANTRA